MPFLARQINCRETALPCPLSPYNRSRAVEKLHRKGGDGNAVSLPLIEVGTRHLEEETAMPSPYARLIVGKRHCRVLYLIPAQPELRSFLK